MVNPAAGDRVYVPSEVARAGSTADLCEQFMLSKGSDAPEGFQTDVLASWTLAHHPTLPVISIRSDDGNSDGDGRLGWLLGYPITPDGRLLGDGSSIVADADPVTFVDSLGGRFLAVFVDVPTPAVYPDAAGSYSSVFCPSLGIAASTPGLVPYDDTTGDRLELVQQLGIPLTNSMYPLGLTPRHGVHRLLPNHHLDLNDWTMVRHGPRWHERGSVSVEESVSRVAAILRRNIVAVIDAHPSYLQLTAGHDSRTILACARERRSGLAAYTLEMPDLDGRNDAKVAAQISKMVGISHQTVPMLEPDPRDLEMWMYRISCGVGEPRGWRATTAYRSLDHSRVHLTGNIGDLARLLYWGPTDKADSSPTMEQLARHALAHLRKQLDPGQRRAAASTTVLEEIERWRDTAPALDAFALLDLLFVENRQGCWAGVWPYAQYYGPGFTLFPMNHREVIAHMAGLPETVRCNETFNKMVIRQEWPELLDVPFNTPSRSVRAAYFPTRVTQGARRRINAAVGRNRR